MDNVDRMYRHLVRTLRTSFPQFLTQPFQVGELYQTILPYRLHRRELGLETNQDYELTLLELLAGSKGYLVVDDKMRDVLNAEHSSVNPNATKIRDFALEHVALAPEALAELQGGRTSTSPGTPSVGGITEPRTSATAAFRATPGTLPPDRTSQTSAITGQSDAARRTAKPVMIGANESCPYCKGALPAGRQISYCPHCGQNMAVVHCPACGSELERGWRFCVACGRAAEAVAES
jgi:hypothetical protein